MKFAAVGAHADKRRRRAGISSLQAKAGAVRWPWIGTIEKRKALRNPSAPQHTTVRGSITGRARRSLPVSSLAAGM